MPCNNQTANYLNFKCYSTLKPYFTRNKITSRGEECLEIGKQALRVKGKYNDSYSEFLYYLAGAFTEYHPLLQIGKIPSCMLINYMLYTKFGSKYTNVDKATHEVYMEFTDKFFDLYNSKSNSCRPYMKYLGNDDFYKMKTLYTLYDEYEKFAKDIKQNNNTLCSYLGVLRDNYYLLLNKYDGKEHNDELLDKLKKFKELLRTKVLETNGNCLEAIEHFKTPTSYTEIKQKEEQAAKAEKERLRAQEAEQERARAQEAEQERARAEEQAQELQIPQEIHVTQDELRGPLFIQPPYVDTKLSERYRSGEIQTNHIDPHLYESENPRSTSQGGEGIIHSIRGTFNSIVENVEPAPILGVSGGMGVLFIILKYTPVGTFYRGRGKRRLIPGSFGGEYPGFMPNFQGYEYGNLANDQFNIAYARE